MKIIVLETEIAGREVMKEMAAMFSLTANYQVLGSFSLPWAFCYSIFHTLSNSWANKKRSGENFSPISRSNMLKKKVALLQYLELNY